MGGDQRGETVPGGAEHRHRPIIIRLETRVAGAVYITVKKLMFSRITYHEESYSNIMEDQNSLTNILYSLQREGFSRGLK